MKSLKSAEHRKIVFHSLDEFSQEVKKLVTAEQSGKLRLNGNWSLGQIFGHLATWITYAFEGAPMRVPWIVKLLMRIRGKRKFITEPMPKGVHIPGVKGGTLATDEISTEAGHRQLATVIERLKREAPERPHPLFGPMTHDEWIQLHLRHAELHLGYAFID